MARLLLAETSEQVRDLARRHPRRDSKWIALGPSAMESLTESGLPFSIPEDFCPIPAQEAACRESQARVDAFCRRMDGEAWGRDPKLERAGMRPFLFHFIAIASLADGLVSRILQLHAILKAHPSAVVSVHDSGPLPWSRSDLAFAERETLYGRLLSLRGWKRNIESIPWGAGSPGPAAPGRRWRPSDLPYPLPMASAFAHLRRRDWAGLKSLIGEAHSAVLVLNWGYDWQAVLPDLAARGVRIYRADTRFRDSGLKPVKEGGADLSGFDQCGIAFGELLRGRVDWIEARGGERARDIQLQARRWTRGRCIQAALSSSASTFDEFAAEQSLRNLGIPVVKWQHGFLLMQDRITQFFDLRDMLTSDLVLCFGEGPRSAFESCKSRYPSRITPVGSASLDRIRSRPPSRAADGPKRLLYATTNFYENKSYCGYSPFFSDRLFYSDQKAILSGLAELQRAYGSLITVKLPSGSQADPPWSRKTAGFELVRTAPGFTELLADCDAVILDSPTTTALQAAASGKPMFVLTSHFEYPPEAAMALGRRAACAATASALIAALGAWIGSGEYPADPRDDDFLRKYGNYRNDGLSAARARDAVLSLVGIESRVSGNGG